MFVLNNEKVHAHWSLSKLYIMWLTESKNLR